MPTVFLPHGGGPYSYVEFGAPADEVDLLVRYWRSIATAIERPEAMVVVSAHWETAVPTVMRSQKPPLLFDYTGFPKASYAIQWPAPGAPDVADRVAALLQKNDIDVDVDDERGFDHGVFVPLGRTFSHADIPTIQLSLKRGLNAQFHLDMGRALAPLRDEGVLLVGSGMSYHNMQGFSRPDSDDESQSFDDWLCQTVSLSAATRNAQLATWENAPAARACHPREEHLIPLMVMAGAAGDDMGRATFRGTVFGKAVSGVQFGG